MSGSTTDPVFYISSCIEIFSRDKIEKDVTENEIEKKCVPLIAQFSTKFSQEEMKKQISKEAATKLTPSINKKESL